MTMPAIVFCTFNIFLENVIFLLIIRRATNLCHDGHLLTIFAIQAQYLFIFAGVITSKIRVIGDSNHYRHHYCKITTSLPDYIKQKKKNTQKTV